MRVEQQYIDIFRNYHEQLCNHSSSLLNEKRENAVLDFEKNGFPSTSDEDYRYSDLAAAFAPDYGLNINRLHIPSRPMDVFKCDVPNLSTNLFFMVNDQILETEQAKGKLPEGVFAGSLNKFAELYPEIAEKHYASLADTDKDAIAAINTFLVQDGYVLYLPKGVVVEKPIQLVTLLRADVDFMTNRRILIIAEDRSEAKILVCDHAVDSVKFLATQVVEIIAGKGVHLDYYELEETSDNTSRFSTLYLSQDAESNVMVNGITLHNGYSRNNYRVTLQGEYAETHLCGMAISDKKQHVDTYSMIDHAVPNCTSNELFKYVLNDEATGAFSGRILVQKGAQKTAAFQTNRNLCATKSARMWSKPQLEIYADDVKCSHGMTTGQLDDKALFYMRSRGIPEKEARLLLMFAFTSDVIENVRLEALRDRLKMLVEMRFRGELAKCGGCAVCK